MNDGAPHAWPKDMDRWRTSSAAGAPTKFYVSVARDRSPSRYVLVEKGTRISPAFRRGSIASGQYFPPPSSAPAITLKAICAAGVRPGRSPLVAHHYYRSRTGSRRAAHPAVSQSSIGSNLRGENIIQASRFVRRHEKMLPARLAADLRSGRARCSTPAVSGRNWLRGKSLRRASARAAGQG